MTPLPRLFMAASLACVLGSPLAAQDPLRPEDQLRLTGFDAAFGAAVHRALAGGGAEDISALTRALSGVPLVAIDESLQGPWRCRTLRLGGEAPLTAFTDFTCRFDLQADGVLFEKSGGSQRTRGKITYRDGRAIYHGTGFSASTTKSVPAYAALPADLTTDSPFQPDIALFERVAPDRARLLFLAPGPTSDFEILELTR